MNIKEAKEQVGYTVKSYLTKNAEGEYTVPLVRQRPIFLMGPPGIGKTAIMEQVADELEIAIVSYSMTHHTRQSALGLPFIIDKVYDGKTVRVTEYTMSEIISSIYDAMEETGRKEGILFLDEINCVSETLAPSMLQFLQFKTFGRHKIPAGWVVVTAGNPPEYNDSVRDFDIVTWDRLKRIDIGPDFNAWKEYAYKKGIHASIITYLNIRPQDFYLVQTTVDGKSFVTARGWEDLSSIICLYEENDFPVDINLVSQYIQNARIAEDFSIYYILYRKYKSDYQIDKILEGDYDDAIVSRAGDAKFDERLTVLGLLLDNLGQGFRKVYEQEEVLRILVGNIKSYQNDMCMGSASSAMENVALVQKKLDTEAGGTGDTAELYKLAGKRLAEMVRDIQDTETADGAAVYAALKELVAADNAARKELAERCGSHLSNVFGFVEKAFDSNEMLILVTELTCSFHSSNYISHYGSNEYFAHNRDLQFYERQKEIDLEINKMDL